MVAAAASGGEPTLGAAPTAQGRPPVLAYYYIWFNSSTSWDRAKTDYPTLGRYSSDDVEVMRQHIRWAKAAGIDGFIVSWKSTNALDARLDSLIATAAEENFKLAIIYQGLDFYRSPLPIEKVEQYLVLFVQRYGREPVFDLFGRPLIIWSGTWEFHENDIARVSSRLGEAVDLLASEKNVEGYIRVADFVDGDAYYWSSVNPDTFPDYPGKLLDMSAAIHARDGIWIAPAAPGFDARLIGGTSVVERHDGETLARQVHGAQQSDPDALGIISWNEFSENSHVEPSLAHGSRYLEVLAATLGSAFEPDRVPAETDRVSPVSAGYGVPLLVGTTVIGLAGIALLRRRRRRPALHLHAHHAQRYVDASSRRRARRL
jgi:hypothetical protein